MNGAYWLNVLDRADDGTSLVANLTDSGKLAVEAVQTRIEAALIHSLLRPSDIGRWMAKPQVHILMVQDPERRRGYDEDWLSEHYPRAYAYLKRFEPLLRGRSGYKRYFQAAGAPFYSVLNVGTYTFAPYKVVWPRMASRLAAAVVPTGGGGLAVPQETVTFIPLDDPREAHFICAAVNSSPFNFAVQSSSQRGGKSFGTPSILENVRIPKFDPADRAHLRLAAISKEAHDADSEGQLEQVERQVDDVAAGIWSLSPLELRAIQESLIELEMQPLAADEAGPFEADARAKEVLVGEADGTAG
jgi:hypothetical protein